MAQSLNIAIIGYGKMGREIEKCALAKGYNIECIIDQPSDWSKVTDKVQVAVEFSTPSTAVENILRCFELGIPVVCGTTAWHQQLPEVQEICKKRNQTLFYASNFSIGVNIYFEINKRLAELMANFGEYTPSITEIHHAQKLDAPSGTAIVLATQLAELHKGYQGWKLSDGNSSQGLIPIKSIREEQVPGTHIVEWTSSADTLEINHTAHNRTGFAKGALLAASWVWNRKGIYTMKDILNL